MKEGVLFGKPNKFYKNIHREGRLCDEAGFTVKSATQVGDLRFVNPAAGPYVRGKTHTPTIGGAFSAFKRDF